MLSSSGPTNIAGNNVSTSIFIDSAPNAASPGLDSFSRILARLPRLFSGFLARVIFHDLQRATEPLFGAARQQQGANRVDRHALPPDHFAHILRVQAQLINSSSFPLDRRYGDGVRILHQTFDDVFEKRLHSTKN